MVFDVFHDDAIFLPVLHVGARAVGRFVESLAHHVRAIADPRDISHAGYMN